MIFDLFLSMYIFRSVLTLFATWDNLVLIQNSDFFYEFRYLINLLFTVETFQFAVYINRLRENRKLNSKDLRRPKKAATLSAWGTPNVVVIVTRQGNGYTVVGIGNKWFHPFTVQHILLIILIDYSNKLNFIDTIFQQPKQMSKNCCQNDFCYWNC